ncbi:MAG TPA: M20/M25/M40 family metallo-hydrolase, partial [Rhizomicrobium sp.]|nr:M20/M25/M40 family metallo-hydrolase [Rhizomicrobium sp.]
MWRISALAALAAGIWLLAAYGTSRPMAQGPDAPAGQFSAARADAVLGRLLDGQHPHPAGSAEDAAMRGRILKELAALEISGRTSSQMSCFSDKRFGALSCGTVTNIIADVSPGSGERIILMAHADSVAAGPGAADDASSVATILETIRALKARNQTGGHPIRALFTDGEEAGLLGAAAYLRDPATRAETGAVINMEARGNHGPSYLFQTGPGDARLIDLYAGAVSNTAASSLYAEIYKVLPNDTDMSPFLAAGVTGYNFAFIGNGAQYHTPLDRHENLDPRSLQQHGENALGVADALRRADLNSLKSGNAIYLDILGRWLPRLPARWSLALSVLAFLLIVLAARFETRRSWKAFLMPPLLLLGAVGMGFVLHGLAAWISGEPDPSFAHPLALRLSLALGAFGIALLTARAANAAASWLWLAGLAVVCAICAPGVVPYFLFPCLVAAPLLLLGRGHGAFLLAAAVAALVVWLPFNQGSEAIMGLSLHPLFVITAAFGLIALLPLMAKARGLGVCAFACLGLAIVLAAMAGMQPAYSSTEPEP